MPEIKLVLCPIDFSEFSVRAYRQALSVAEHYHSRLVALHIVELWRYPSLSFVVYPNDYAEFCQALHEHGKKQLQEFIKNNTHGKTQPEIVVKQESAAADFILSFAREQKADLIVMGTHGRRGYQRLVLGSVTDRVIRSASCPVLAVTQPGDSLEAGKELRHEHRLNRILFCTDFSSNSEQALNYAISATAEYDAELILLHALEETPSVSQTEQAIDAATEQLKQLLPPKARKSLKTKFVVRVGKPYQQIVQLAKEAHIDMVAMGVSGRGALDLAMFGSTTYRAIQLGPCPVLAVHNR